MSLFRSDHEAAVVRVQILEAELALQRTLLVESEEERSRLQAALAPRHLMATRPGRPSARARRPASVAACAPRPMSLSAWTLLVSGVALGLVGTVLLGGMPQ